MDQEGRLKVEGQPTYWKFGEEKDVSACALSFEPGDVGLDGQERSIFTIILTDDHRVCAPTLLLRLIPGDIAKRLPFRNQIEVKESSMVRSGGITFFPSRCGDAQGTVWGAVGCDLNDPDRDVARLFPESTGYKTIYTSILQKGGEKLLATVETRLGDKFHGIYETIDVPYTIYEIFANKKKIGYIHGVNQKGQFGGIQVSSSSISKGRIKGFYIQKMTSQYAGKLRDAKFGKQFIGLTLKDFDHYDVISGKASGKVEAIKIRPPKLKRTSWQRSGPRKRILFSWTSLSTHRS